MKFDHSSFNQLKHEFHFNVNGNFNIKEMLPQLFLPLFGKSAHEFSAQLNVAFFIDPQSCYFLMGKIKGKK